jgi:hypothetical protein
LDQANKRKAAAAAAAAAAAGAPASSTSSKKAAASSQMFAAVRGKDWQVTLSPAPHLKLYISKHQKQIFVSNTPIPPVDC